MKTLFLSALTALLVATPAFATDWTRFRGPQGSGVVEEASIPLEWSSDKNLKWKSALPGKGTSSPVIVGDRIYLTAYTGYGVDAEEPGNADDLVRHVICIDRKSGKELWRKSVQTTAKEDPYKGFITQHGYASSTVAADGNMIYAVLGKSGLFALDKDGKQVWQADLGTKSDPAKWGDGSSPIVVGDIVIVDAGILGNQLIGFNKGTGERAWVIEDKNFTNSWSTPIALEIEGTTQVLFNAPGKVLAIDPTNGKQLWSAESPIGRTTCGGIIASKGVGYLMGGREGNAMGVKLGGSGDMSATNTVWKSRLRSGICTPVIVGDAMYWTSGGLFYSAGLNDGEYIYRERLPRKAGGGGGFGNASYASPIAVGENIIQVSRNGESYVIKAGKEFEVVTHNPAFDGDDSDFSASPAVSDGDLFLRSEKFLYCIGE